MKIFKSVRNHKGFTLVELAIVLVIIGIILGSVLKGQELINNARMKRAFNQQREITAAVYTYFDRYGFFPGDDPNATTRWATAANGNGDGLIGGTTATMFVCSRTAAPTTETCGIWQHLRFANIIPGSQVAATSGGNPSNAFGGAIGIANVMVPTTGGLTANWIGLSTVPTYVAVALDTQNDDGDALTGQIRGLVAYAPTTPDVLISFFFRL
jgi:prepilin-type N-terminal cleavage/methylation domain-containing protein